jgi:hypothetical protein
MAGSISVSWPDGFANCGITFSGWQRERVETVYEREGVSKYVREMGERREP